MDFFYWKNIVLNNIFNVNNIYNCNGKYILFESWNGGLNNKRMSLELACAIAFRMNRILVIPKLDTIAFFNKSYYYDNFFDINDIGIKHISMDEFCKLKNIENNWETIKSICNVYNFIPDNSYINLIVENQEPINQEKLIKYSTKRHIINIHNNSDCIFFDKNLLGTFYTMIYDNKMYEISRYIKRHLHYREHIFMEANKIINYILKNNGIYYSIHIRRTDFLHHYNFVCVSIENIFDNIQQIIPIKTNLYISTDITDISELKILFDNYNVILLKDITHLIDLNINEELIGLIEQIICSRGIKFVGTQLSTFSNYIYRLRGYMNDIDDKKYYINNSSKHDFDDKSWIDMWGGNDNIWSREFIDGFTC